MEPDQRWCFGVFLFEQSKKGLTLTQRRRLLSAIVPSCSFFAFVGVFLKILSIQFEESKESAHGIFSLDGIVASGN